MPIVGTQQSPIRIESTKTLQAQFPAGYLKVGYSGKPLKGTFSGDNFVFSHHEQVEANGTRWTLRKIHMHSPAEHRLDDELASDFECHLVHSWECDQDLIGPKLVIGVFFRVVKKATSKTRSMPTTTALNETMRPKTSKVSKAGKSGKAVDQHHLDPTEFLHQDAGVAPWFHYQGSLTSSPFSEDVSWFVLRDEVEVHHGEVDMIMKEAKQEAREAFPLDRRFVLRNFA